MLLTPKLHVALDRLVAALASGDDATVAAILTSSDLAGRGAELAQALARWFPQVRTLGASASDWPVSLSQRCLMWFQDERTSPFHDEAWLLRPDPPHGLNWLAGLDELIAATACSQSFAATLWTRFCDRDLDAVLDTLRQSEAARPRAWCWLATLMFASAERHAGEAMVRDRLESMIESSPAQVPPSLQALVLARQASAGRSPEIGLQRSMRSLNRGHARDIALGGALAGLCNTSVLATTLVERLVVIPEHQTVVIARTRDARRWHQILQWLLKSNGIDQSLFHVAEGIDAASGAPHGFGPAHAEVAADLCRLADELAAAASPYPVTLASIGVLLWRLRRPDLLLRPSLNLAAAEPDPAVAHLLQRALSRADRRWLVPPASSPQSDSTPAFPAQVPNAAPGARGSEAVTICILNYNGSLATHRLLTSLHRLWRGFAGEVIVLDNASDTSDLALLTQQILKLWPGRLRIFQATENLGIGPARNLLFNQVRTPWILSLDNDMIPIVDPGDIVEAAVCSQKSSFFNLAYEEIDNPGVAGFGKAWSIESCETGANRYKTSYQEFGPRDRPGAGGQTYIASNRLSGGSSLLRKDAFFALGGYAPVYAIGFEDYEFSFRMAGLEQPVLTPLRTMFVHGHLAPRDAVEVSTVLARFDRQRLKQAQSGFEARLRQQFEAVDNRNAPKSVFRELPRRLDLRHINGPQAFKLRQPIARHVALITGAGLDPAVVQRQLGQANIGVAVFDQSEFPTPEHGLLLLQSFTVIAAEAAFVARLSSRACAGLGLIWPDENVIQAPVVCIIGSEVPGAAQIICDLGASVRVHSQVTDFVAFLIR